MLVSHDSSFPHCCRVSKKDPEEEERIVTYLEIEMQTLKVTYIIHVHSRENLDSERVLL